MTRGQKQLYHEEKVTAIPNSEKKAMETIRAVSAPSKEANIAEEDELGYSIDGQLEGGTKDRDGFVLQNRTKKPPGV